MNTAPPSLVTPVLCSGAMVHGPAILRSMVGVCDFWRDGENDPLERWVSRVWVK